MDFGPIYPRVGFPTGGRPTLAVVSSSLIYVGHHLLDVLLLLLSLSILRQFLPYAAGGGSILRYFLLYTAGGGSILR